MNFETNSSSFFSALGVFNGFLVSLYFAIVIQRKKFLNYFLALLLLVLCIRIIKSVFLFFNSNLFSVLFK